MGILIALLRLLVRCIAGVVHIGLALLRILGLRPHPKYFSDWQGLPQPPQPPPSSSFDLVGCDLASIMFSYIDAEEARRLLPEGLVLDPPAGTPAGKHPALYSFNYHRGIRPYFLPWPTSSYLESLFGLPYVRIEGDPSGPYSVMTDLRLNDFLALLIGRLEGYPKHLAGIGTTETDWNIFGPLGGPLLLGGEFQPVGRQTTPRELANFGSVRAMLEQRVVSRDFAGSFVISGFHIDFSTAIVQPLQVHLDVKGDGLPGLPAGTHVFERIDHAPAGIGAFRSLHSWQTLTPLPVLERRAAAASAAASG